MAVEEVPKDSEEPSPASLHEAQKLYDFGCSAIRSESYDEAVDCLSKALEIQVQHYGELGRECASTYCKYGCALFFKAQAESDALGDTKASEGQRPGSSSQAEGSTRSVNEASEDVEDANGDGEGKEEEEGEEGAEEDEDAAEEEENDLELAWKMLDIARVIYAKEPQRTLAEVDVITTLGDISLEKEDFQLCFEDYATALQELEELVESDSRRIAELCFKISLAKQMDQKPKVALEYCKRAVFVCEQRLEKLTKARAKETVAEGKAIEGVKKINDKEKEIVGDGESAEQLERGSIPSGQEKLKDEVKEVEELLVDLREKVEELEQMAAAPTLYDALKAAHFENVVMMKQNVNSSNGGGSSSSVNVTALTGSSSVTPVTNLGVMGRGVKRLVPTPVDEQLSPPDVQTMKKTADDMLNVGASQ